MLNVQVNNTHLPVEEQATRNDAIVIAAYAIHVAGLDTLDDVQKMLNKRFGDDTAWVVHQGGGHVALIARLNGGVMERVLMVTEFAKPEVLQLSGNMVEVRAGEISVTNKELQVLRAVLNSEYQQGDTRDDVVGHHVWSSYCNPFGKSERRAYGGVIASLVKKGLLRSGGSSSDANHAAGCDGYTLALTADGFKLATTR